MMFSCGMPINSPSLLFYIGSIKKTLYFLFFLSWTVSMVIWLPGLVAKEQPLRQSGAVGMLSVCGSVLQNSVYVSAIEEG